MLLIACLALFSEAPAFAQALLTDFNVRPEPALPTINAAGDKIIDPTFGTTILRVTDARDGSFGRALYSSYPSVNVNSTRIFGNVNSGGTRIKLWDLDATNFRVSNGRFPSGVPNMEQYFSLWSGTNPDMFYGGGGGCVCVWYYNVASSTGGKLFDLTARIPGATQSSQIQRSTNDDVWSMNLLNSGGGIIGYAVYKRSTDTIIASTVTTSTNETYVDKSGHYFWVTLGGGCNTQMYTVAVPPVLFGTQSFCHNGAGVSSVFTYGSNGLTIRHLPDITPTVLMGGYFPLTNQSLHVSFNYTGDSYGLVCRHTDGAQPNNPVTAAFDKEIVLVSTSGNAVKRIAHHRSVTGTGYGYYDTPFANISPDGQFVAFTSNWGGTSGHNRQDLYLVKIPAVGGGDAKPPTAPSGLSVK